MSKQILIEDTTNIIRIILTTMLIIVMLITGLFFYIMHYHDKSIETLELQTHQFKVSITELESKYEKLIQLNKEK